MTNTSNTPTPRSVRDELQEAYKETTDFDTELFNALFAALTMLEKMEARIDTLEAARPVDTLEAARPVDTPKVLYEGEASVLRDGIPVLTLGARIALHGHKRVHIVVTAAAEEDES